MAYSKSTEQLLEDTLPTLVALEASAGIFGQPATLRDMPTSYSVDNQKLSLVFDRVAALDAGLGMPTDGSFSFEMKLPLLSARIAALQAGPVTPPNPVVRRQTVGIFDMASNTLVAMPVIDELYTTDKIKWDGFDLRGNVAPTNRTYQARPITNAADLTVAGTWKGVVANNSDSFTGPGVWGSNRPSCKTFRGNRGRYGASYIERGSGHNWFEVGTPGARVKNPAYLEESQSVDAICSDAERTYHGGTSFGQHTNPVDGKTNVGYFISATLNGPETEYAFTSGETFQTETQRYSACDVSGVVFEAIGLAVQQQGRLLLSLHPDKLVFFDKLAGGAPLGSVPVTNPMAVALVNDTTIALIHGTTVELYTLDPVALTLTSQRAVPLPDNYVPRSLAFSPVAPTLSIVCGGVGDAVTSTATHRVLHYNRTNYDATPRVEGTGDFALDLNVTDNTFCFFNITDGKPGHPYIAYQEDGSYWFSDEGNKREQHRAADGTLLYTRYCANTTYSPTMVGTDPSRLINGFLEYEVDHSKPKIPNNSNGWWKLKYNRCCSRIENFYATGNNITTTAAGRTFSLERYINKQVLCEWRTTAPGMRYFEQISIDLTGALDENGDILEVEGFYAGETKRIFRSALTGYPSPDGPPTFAAKVLEGSAPLTATTANSTGMFCGPTSDGTYPCYALAEGPFHLAGIKRNATDFRFTAAPSTWLHYQGPFPTKGEYEVGNAVRYGGTMVCVVDNYIVWGFRGEGFKNAQTTKFMITTSDGRYVGQFGTVRDGAFQSLLEDAAPGQGGNALTFRLVKVIRNGRVIYVLIHGDENNHGGFHIWEFDLSSAREETPYAITATTPEPLPGVSLMGDIPFDQLEIVSGSTIGNWRTSGDMKSDTSRQSRTSLMFYMADGAHASAPFPAGSQPGGYSVVGSYAWLTLGGLSQFLYPIAGLELKDTNGNIFLRLAHLDDGNGNTINTANGVVLTQGVALVAAQETAELRPFRLRVTQDGKLFFIYNGRDEVALPAFSGIKPGTDNEPYITGNPLLPGTVEVNLKAYANGKLLFAVDQLRLLPNLT